MCNTFKIGNMVGHGIYTPYFGYGYGIVLDKKEDSALVKFICLPTREEKIQNPQWIKVNNLNDEGKNKDGFCNSFNEANKRLSLSDVLKIFWHK